MAEETAAKKGMESYRRLELIQCPRCGKNTLEYSHGENSINYLCVNPTCDYKSVKKLEPAEKKPDGTGVLLVALLCLAVLFAVAGVSVV